MSKGIAIPVLVALTPSLGPLAPAITRKWAAGPDVGGKEPIKFHQNTKICVRNFDHVEDAD